MLVIEDLDSATDLETSDTQITETDNESLLLSEQETEHIIESVRDITEQDISINRERVEMLQELHKSDSRIVVIDGEEHILLFRCVKPGHDLAPVASGLANWRGIKQSIQEKVTFVI